MTLRVDNSLKKNYDNLCEEFGFTTTAAITVFMKTVMRERRIPFEIKAASKDEINAKGWEAILKLANRLRKQVFRSRRLLRLQQMLLWYFITEKEYLLLTTQWTTTCQKTCQ